MFRVIGVRKPLFAFGKLWFTTSLNGIHQLHVGIFDKVKNELRVWKSRTIRPRIKMVPDGISYHRRNPVLDEQRWKTVVSVPFLQNNPWLIIGLY